MKYELHRQSDIIPAFEGVASTPCVVMAHGCNCRQVMGAGLAKTLSRRYPAILTRDQLTCDALRKPGNAFLGHSFEIDGIERQVWNLYTQLDPGPCADLVSIGMSINMMLTKIAGRRIDTTLHLPLIGCGLGGVEIREYIHLLNVLDDYSFVKEVHVHTLL